MKPRNMDITADGFQYRTEISTLLASDAYWDGKNWERKGRNQFLFRTPNGRYFMQYQSSLEEEVDHLHPKDERSAIQHFETLPKKEMAFSKAFPGVEIKEA